jgi:peptidoglycan/LPS O-acetylase OafA/YrhL
MKDIKGLTGLRGIAAIWVCIFHYSYENDFGRILTPLAQAGHHGVPVFFALSGFILAYIYGKQFADGRASYWRFLALRVARVYPLHLVLWLAIGYAFIAGVHTPSDRDTGTAYVLGLFMAHAWGFNVPVNWNDPAWSISTEFAAYLIFPLFAGRLTRASVGVSVAVIATMLLTFMTFWMNPLLAKTGLPGAHFTYGGGLPYWLLLFASGVALYQVAEWLMERIKEPGFYDALMALGLILMIVPQIYDNVPWWQLALASLLIVLGLFRDAGVGRALFGNPVVTWLGEISYALYLSHQLLVFVWVAALAEWMPGTWFYQVPLSLKLLVAVCVAAVLHYGFEKPVRSGLRKLMTRASMASHVTSAT